MIVLCRDIMNNIYKMYVFIGLFVMFLVLFSCFSFGFMGWGGGGVILFIDV